MTQLAIQQQIEAIRKASAEALKSKETARQFLIDAGIIKEEKKTPTAVKKKWGPHCQLKHVLISQSESWLRISF